LVVFLKTAIWLNKNRRVAPCELIRIKNRRVSHACGWMNGINELNRYQDPAAGGALKTELLDEMMVVICACLLLCRLVDAFILCDGGVGVKNFWGIKSDKVCGQ